MTKYDPYDRRPDEDLPHWKPRAADDQRASRGEAGSRSEVGSKIESSAVEGELSTGRPKILARLPKIDVTEMGGIASGPERLSARRNLHRRVSVGILLGGTILLLIVAFLPRGRSRSGDSAAWQPPVPAPDAALAPAWGNEKSPSAASGGTLAGSQAPITVPAVPAWISAGSFGSAPAVGAGAATSATPPSSISMPLPATEATPPSRSLSPAPATPLPAIPSNSSVLPPSGTGEVPRAVVNHALADTPDWSQPPWSAPAGRSDLAPGIAVAAPGNTPAAAAVGGNMTNIGTTGIGSAFAGNAEAVGVNPPRAYGYPPVQSAAASSGPIAAPGGVPLSADRTALPSYPRTSSSGSLDMPTTDPRSNSGRQEAMPPSPGYYGYGAGAAAVTTSAYTNTTAYPGTSPYPSTSPYPGTSPYPTTSAYPSPGAYPNGSAGYPGNGQMPQAASNAPMGLGGQRPDYRPASTAAAAGGYPPGNVPGAAYPSTYPAAYPDTTQYPQAPSGAGGYGGVPAVR